MISSLFACTGFRTSSIATLVMAIGGLAIASANAFSPAAMAPGPCPSARELSKLLAFGDLYFGETHGTNESPAFVRCVVKAAIAKGPLPVYVSLELPAAAADLKSRVWSGVDGRTSQAYAALLVELQVLEKTRKVVVDYQLTDVADNDIEGNRDIGRHIRSLEGKGRVIAVGGSMHAQRRQAILPEFTFKPAGGYTGEGIKSVLLDTSGPGQAWQCSAQCKAGNTDRLTDASPAGTLKDGAAVGFDYVYVLPPFTASKPLISP